MSPGDVLNSAGTVGLAMIMWSLCGFIACLGSLCYLGIWYPV